MSLASLIVAGMVFVGAALCAAVIGFALRPSVVPRRRTVRRVIAAMLFARLIRSTATRKPNFIVGSEADAYLLRWFVIPRNRFFNIYLHQFLRSDDDRALHDHPWTNISFILAGMYTEHTIAAGGVNVRKIYTAGDLKIRRAVAAHRIELHGGPCWSLFITGPRLREWGFHCPAGWKHWEQFTKRNSPGEIGPGCDDASPDLAHNKSRSEHAGTSA